MLDGMVIILMQHTQYQLPVLLGLELIMTKQTEALKMAIEAMEITDESFTEFSKGLVKLGVPASILKLDKQSILIPAIQACKEALEQPNLTYEDGFAHGYEAHRAEQALEQPAQEPVAWMNDIAFSMDKELLGTRSRIVPLYTHPAPVWQGLSDLEIAKIIGAEWWREKHRYARAIEAKLKEKNT